MPAAGDRTSGNAARSGPETFWPVAYLPAMLRSMRLFHFLRIAMAAGALLGFALQAHGEELPAAKAKIAGGARYDGGEAFRCIRYWGSTNVTATWKTEVPAKGTWRVFVTYACPKDLAGSEFEMSLGDQKVNGTTVSTGGWETFKEMDLGPVIFRKPGKIDVVLRVTRMRKSSCWDLRAVRLAPES